MSPEAIVLVSGGMDSCVAAALAADKYRLALLHCEYGQRTAARERRAFDAIADHYDVETRLIVTLDHFRTIGGSALTDRSRPMPAGDLARTDIPDTYVPFRNGNLLAAAVTWAEARGAAAVVIGAVEEDGSGYPDCRRTFFDAFQQVITAGTRPQAGIRLETPLIGMRKEEIVRTGLRLGAPLYLTWSCYRAEDRPCGRCDSCLLRRRAFAAAGVADPIETAGNREAR